MTTVYVYTNTTNTNSEYSDEPYGDWTADYDFEVTSVTLEKPQHVCDYETFNTSFNVEEGDSIYVLSMIYSSGDSFGSSSGNGEVIWVFKDVEFAKAAAQALRKHENDFSVKFKDESGQEITMHNPGAGYFEHISSIDVERFTVGKIGKISF